MSRTNAALTNSEIADLHAKIDELTARAEKAEAENERLRGSCAYEKERGAALLAAVARAGKAEDEHRIAMDLLRQLTDDVTALTQQVETLEAKNARWKQLIQLRLMALGDPAKPSSDSEPPGTSSPSLSNPRSPDGKW
jgi:cell division protein FtsB